MKMGVIRVDSPRKTATNEAGAKFHGLWWKNRFKRFTNVRAPTLSRRAVSLYICSLIDAMVEPRHSIDCILTRNGGDIRSVAPLRLGPLARSAKEIRSFSSTFYQGAKISCLSLILFSRREDSIGSFADWLTFIGKTIHLFFFTEADLLFLS